MFILEPFPQPMHVPVFNQLVIISQKGNLVEAWTFLKKSFKNNPQNNVVGKETYQKAKYLPVADHTQPKSFHF